MRPLGRADDVEHHPQRRRLARAVAAKEAEHLAPGTEKLSSSTASVRSKRLVTRSSVNRLKFLSPTLEQVRL